MTPTELAQLRAGAARGLMVDSHLLAKLVARIDALTAENERLKVESDNRTLVEQRIIEHFRSGNYYAIRFMLDQIDKLKSEQP